VGDLNELLANLAADPILRGKQFEHICKWFLTNCPLYRRELRRVWLWDEWPGRWGPDSGIDLVAEEHGGRLWAIQAKAYDPAYSITKHDVDTFLAESGRPEFTFRLLIATTNRIGTTAERTLIAQEKQASRLLLGDLRAADVEWPRSPSDLRPTKPKPKRPKPHQRKAISAVVQRFQNVDRGQLIMACGTGKTLTAQWIAQRLGAKRTLVLVPSLSLLADTLREWTANDEEMAFLPVCSDDTVKDTDAAVSTTTDLGFPVTTDPQDIATFLRRRSGRLVAFATYQSSPKIADAYGQARLPSFDLVIADEAHRCAGRVSSDFATVLDSNVIPSRKRLFMTATPRFFTGRVVREAKEADFEVASMDDECRFGPVLHRLGFAEAIRKKLLTDYQVIIVGVDDATYLEWAQRGRFVTIDGTEVTDARTLAGQIGLGKAMRQYDLRRTISFHSRVSAAREFANSIPRVIDWMPKHQRPKGQLWSDYASGEMTAGDRLRRLDHLRHLEVHERGLLANARCLGEGIDVPALDGVAFIDPRRSEVDIVQAVGRAIRLAEDKTVGTIVLPVFIEAVDDPETALDASAFKPVWDVVRALRAHDDELGEHLDELRRERGLGKRRLRLPQKIHLNLPADVGTDFVDAFDVHLVDQTTASWEFWFGLLERFVERERHPLVPHAHVEHGYRLGNWVDQQRNFHRNGRLDGQRVSRLESLSGWSWTPRQDVWDDAFGRLLAFVEREGHARVPSGLLDDDGYRLGQWVNVQRTLRRDEMLREKRAAKLATLPDWSWNPNESDWDRGFQKVVLFVTHEGHARVPYSHIEDNYKLGQWVAKQRRTYKNGTLATERVTRLEALPDWSWDSRETRESQWEEGYRRLEQFVHRHGHARVSKRFVEEELSLGPWVNMQRNRYRDGELAADRVVRLEALPGWSWNENESRWDEGFRHLSDFVDRNGHPQVGPKYVEDGYRLGQWVAVQRASYRRGNLTSDRANRLESLSGWTWTPRDELWESGFEHLCAYSKREGHALVPGHHMEDGFRLGQWVNNQRGLYRSGAVRLTADRIAKLESVPGWTWSPYHSQWEEGFEQLASFVERKGHARVPNSHVEGDYPLGRWVGKQRQSFSEGRLRADRAARLEALPGWVWRLTRTSH
jgi:superfamily II DNA or RNA helicase